MQLINFTEVGELEITEKYKRLLLNKLDCCDYLKTKFTVFFPEGIFHLYIIKIYVPFSVLEL